MNYPDFHKKKEANNHFIAITKGSKNGETLALESIA